MIINNRWKSKITETSAFDCSSIININQLIDIDCYWFSSIVQVLNGDWLLKTEENNSTYLHQPIKNTLTQELMKGRKDYFSLFKLLQDKFWLQRAKQYRKVIVAKTVAIVALAAAIFDKQLSEVQPLATLCAVVLYFSPILIHSVTNTPQVYHTLSKWPAVGRERERGVSSSQSSHAVSRYRGGFSTHILHLTATYYREDMSTISAKWEDTTSGTFDQIIVDNISQNCRS